MRILVTRPREDAKSLTALLSGQGFDVIEAPLLDIVYQDGPDLDVTGVQAILLTSANGVRAFAQRCSDRSLLVLCVGDATAREAKTEHFQLVKSACGDVETLTALITSECKPDAGALLHPAGTDVAGDLGTGLKTAGYTYRREVLYTAVKATRLPDEVLKALKLKELGGVLLYSPRTAAAFVKLLAKAERGGDLNTVTAYCLSQAVADELTDLHWAAIKIAAKPNQDALLALL
ncbi:MAG: uroporphyrinogen-III synthase [Rhodospirillaceae bacterium]|nr:MAG: uroporphyrinogen-III synthase [Rhodospirillaceae bacterium]